MTRKTPKQPQQPDAPPPQPSDVANARALLVALDLDDKLGTVRAAERLRDLAGMLERGGSVF